MMKELTEYKGQAIPEDMRLFRADNGEIFMALAVDEDLYDLAQEAADSLGITKQTLMERALKALVERVRNG